MPQNDDLQNISGRLERGEIDGGQYLEALMRFVAARIGCSRAGLRMFVETDEARPLRCIAMFDATADRMVNAADIVHPSGSLYLERLQRDGSVISNDAPADAAAAGPLRTYVRAFGVASLMDMSFSVNGVLFGAFSCEQVGEPIEWSQRQQQALRRIASRASLTLMRVVNASVDTAPGALWETSTPNRLATMPMLLDAAPTVSDRPPADPSPPNPATE